MVFTMIKKQSEGEIKYSRKLLALAKRMVNHVNHQWRILNFHLIALLVRVGFLVQDKIWTSAILHIYFDFKNCENTKIVAWASRLLTLRRQSHISQSELSRSDDNIGGQSFGASQLSEYERKFIESKVKAKRLKYAIV